MIPLFYPNISKKCFKPLKKVLQSKQIGEGPKVAEFEKAMDDYLGGPYSLMVNSGTSALYLAYLLAGIKKDDEVIVPVLNCVASPFPLLWLGAKIVFVDIETDTLNIDQEDIERKITKKTKAIVVTHLSGFPVSLERINSIASEYNLKVIEDAAQALGAEYGEDKIGNTGNLSIFSLQSVKTLTCGDGGILRVQTKEQYELAKRLRWFGINRLEKDSRYGQNYDIKEIGYKMNATDIDATIALAGLKELPKWLKQRQMIVDYYIENLRNVPGLQLLDSYSMCSNSNWLFHILVERRDDFIKTMKERGIETNISHVRNDFYTIMKDYKTHCPNMDSVEDSYVCIPLNNNLTSRQVRYIVKSIKKGW